MYKLEDVCILIWTYCDSLPLPIQHNQLILKISYCNTDCAEFFVKTILYQKRVWNYFTSHIFVDFCDMAYSGQISLPDSLPLTYSMKYFLLHAYAFHEVMKFKIVKF